jgi:hypothetical protein
MSGRTAPHLAAITRAAAHAAGQHGLLSRQQAIEAGMSRHQIANQIATGSWFGAGRGVYGIAGAPATWQQQVMAAVLCSHGLASHRCAARLWAIEGYRRAVPEIIVPTSSGFVAEGVRVHRSVDFDLAEPHVRHKIPVTSAVRTVIDLGTRVPIEWQSNAIDDVIRRGLVDWPALYHEMVRLSAKGRNGVGTTRSIVDERFGTRIPDSRWNREVQQLLIQAGLPEPVAEYDVVDAHGMFIGRVDLAYPSLRIAIELQSKLGHFNDRAFERDPLRRNKLQRQGWIVLEYTWRFYVEHPVALVAEVRNEIDARS